jgi:hypothetical protein
VVVPANAVDHPVSYDCPGVQQGDYVGKNTVTIDWSGDSHAYPTTSDSATVDVEVTGDDEPTNATVTLTDRSPARTSRPTCRRRPSTGRP